MDTTRLMKMALEMSGLSDIPGDSGIHHPGDAIGRLLIGIDIKGPELKLAKDLGFDAAVSHHPVGGSSTLRFHEVLYRHIDQMTSAGVPQAVAREAIEAMALSARITHSMGNYDHAPSIARLLDLPYLNIHTPLDEIGRCRMAEATQAVAPEAPVQSLVDAFYERFGEFRHAHTRIEIRVGDPNRPIGRVAVSHGAGTNGGYSVAKAYFDHGVDTLIYIHCRPDDSRRLQEEYGTRKNLIVTGHIASDSVGINPYIDRLRDSGLDVVPISGIIPG